MSKTSWLSGDAYMRCAKGGGGKKNFYNLFSAKLLREKSTEKPTPEKKGYSMNYVFHAPRFEVYEYPRHADEKSRKIVKLME